MTAAVLAKEVTKDLPKDEEIPAREALAAIPISEARFYAWLRAGALPARRDYYSGRYFVRRSVVKLAAERVRSGLVLGADGEWRASNRPLRCRRVPSSDGVLERMRRRTGLSIAETAERLGVKAAAYEGWERGVAAPAWCRLALLGLYHATRRGRP